MSKLFNSKMVAILLVVLSTAIIFTGCGSTTSKISVVGSTSVQPLAQALADEYSKTNTSAKIDIQGVGSTAGIKAIHDGTCDIGTSSRDLTTEEKAWKLTETVIAVDGIAVIVNPANTVTILTTDQIVKIFKGEITNWKDVGGADKEIIVVSREAGSGTRGAFEELLKLSHKSGDKTISDVYSKALISQGNGAVMSNVAGKENSIGYMSIGMVDQTKVKKLLLNGVEATETNVKDKTYTISRPFIMLTKGEPKKEAKAFIDYILSDAGQTIVATDYISIK